MSASAAKWNTSDSREVSIVSRGKWKEIERGFTMALIGQGVLLVFIALAALAFSPFGMLYLLRLGLTRTEAASVGVGALVVGGILGYLLVVAGHWRCLLHAPQNHGAKDMQFASLLCLLTIPIFLVGGHFYCGPQFYTLLEYGFLDLRPMELVHQATVPFFAAFVLAVVSVLLFTCFARAVSFPIKDTGLSRGVSAYFWYVAFLLGGSGGILLEAQRWPQLQTWSLLGLLWVIFLLWHSYLTFRTSQAIAALVRRLGSGVRPALVDSKIEYGQVQLQTSAYRRTH
jgi:hypothetical protein